MRRALATILAPAAIGLGGCGDPSTDDLTQYLPEEVTVLATVDLDAAREELGLPEDADAIDIEAFAGGDMDIDSPEYQLINAASSVVPPVRQFAQTFESPPLLDALDGGAISAGAADQAGFAGAPAVIQTSQSFDELADELADAGYERDGDVVANPDEAISEIADAGDGILVMTGGDEGPTAGELVESPPDGPGELTELLGDTELPIGLATSVEEVSECLTAFGGSQNAAGTEGELVIEVSGEASSDAVGSDALGDTVLDLGEPVIDGAVMTIPFTAPEVANANPVGELLAQLRPLDIYDCG
jgi:hypothetical protein